MSLSLVKTEIETFFGRCRCCLSYGYLKNMWIEHQVDGEAEVYGEMLVQCFALTWDPSEDTMEQDQICEQCICRLRDASDFKKVVLDSQEELLSQTDAENTDIKEERLEEEFLEDQPDSDDVDTTYVFTDYAMDTADTADTADNADTITSGKDDTEYEEVEYLEEVDAGVANEAIDTDSSQVTDQSKRVRTRRKQPRQPDPDEEEGPKRKWPKKLPKSERHKTYKQYSEVDLRKCLEEVRNNVLTAGEASLKYGVPKKTICGKIKVDPSDVRTDIQNSTNNTTSRETVTPNLMEAHIINDGTLQTDTEEIPNKYLMLKHKNNLKCILKYSNATMIKASSSAGYSCCFCDKLFSAERLKKHNFEHGDVYDDAIKVKYVSDLIIKLDITGLKCRLCDEEIDSLEGLISHLQEDHFKSIHTDVKNHFIPFKFDTEELRCAICVLEFKNFKLLSEHMCEHYSNYKCPVCDRVFINKQSMQTHSYRHKKGEYKCSQCPKIFDSPLKIREHEYVTHKLSNKKRKCGFCNEKFSSADLVKNHEAREHGVARNNITCEACDRPFASQNSLATHKRRHHLLMRPFDCDTCGRGFHTRQELDWHTVTHTKTKNFHCNRCENSFATKPGLRQHLKAHIGYRKYKCDYCKMAFVHMSTWKRHVFSIHRNQAGSTKNGIK